MRTSFVSGPGKLWADLGLFFRLFFGAVGRFGFRGAFRELRGYLRDNRNLFDGAAKRYVRRGPHVYAASALPPINSRAFVDYLLEEIHTFNHKQLSPMIMGLISATSRCPYRCKYCYAIDELRTEEVVPVEAVARAVDSLGQMKVPTVFLTGGEVMMRKDDLPAILAPAVAHGMSAYLVSSGWGMDRQTLEGLLPYNLVGVVISLDSRHEERVATSKGQRDAFSRAMGAIAAARDLGLLVSVDCMGTTEVLEDFDAYMDFLADNGVHFVNFLTPNKVGGVVKYDYPVVSTEQFKELEGKMNASNRGRKNRRRPLAYSPMIWEHARGCVAGQQFVYVNPLGEVRPCPFLAEPVGRIQDMPLSEIVARVRHDGERTGCYSMYDDLPTLTRLGKVPKSSVPRSSVPRSKGPLSLPVVGDGGLPPASQASSARSAQE